MTIRRTHVIIDAVKRASRARYEILGRRGRQSRRRGTRQIAASTPHINKNYSITHPRILELKTYLKVFRLWELV